MSYPPCKGGGANGEGGMEEQREGGRERGTEGGREGGRERGTEGGKGRNEIGRTSNCIHTNLYKYTCLYDSSM